MDWAYKILALEDHESLPRRLLVAVAKKKSIVSR